MLDATTVAIINRLTTKPGKGIQLAMDEYIRGLKREGIWTDLDVLWVPALYGHSGEQGALMEWKNGGTFDASKVGSPTFSAGGVRNNSTTGYLNLNWGPTPDGVNYTQTDASVGVYVTSTATDAANTGRYDIGSFGGNANTYLNAWRSTSVGGRMVSTGTGDCATSISTRVGLSMFNRTDSSTATGYRDGSSIGALGSQSNGPISSTYDWYLTVLNNGGGPSSPSDDTIALAWAGASLADPLVMYTLTRRFLSSLGAL